MKIRCSKIYPKIGAAVLKRSEDGMATIIFIALLGIMMLLVVANGRMLMQLRETERLIEQKQIQRLESSQTNSAPEIKSHLIAK